MQNLDTKDTETKIKETGRGLGFLSGMVMVRGYKRVKVKYSFGHTLYKAYTNKSIFGSDNFFSLLVFVKKKFSWINNVKLKTVP